jgi:hypothetical protein
MKLSLVLAQLSANNVAVHSDEIDQSGRRVIIVGCAAPSPPFGLGRFHYYTLSLSKDQDDVSREERDAMRRHLWHGTTDLFGDDKDDIEAGLL